jgi:hypothetical protein
MNFEGNTNVLNVYTFTHRNKQQMELVQVASAFINEIKGHRL